MMNIKTYCITVLLVLITFSSQVFASKDKKPKSDNPFERVIFSVSSTLFTDPKIIRGSYVNVPTGESKKRIIQLGVEVPYYKDIFALGFQYSTIASKNLVGNEYTLSAILRYPMHFRFGHVAIVNSYQAGLLRVDYHSSDEQNNQFFQYGGVFTPSIGIDYFPISWVGVFCRYSWSVNHIVLNKAKLFDLNYDTQKNDPYTYTTTAVTFGIKMTF